MDTGSTGYGGTPTGGKSSITVSEDSLHIQFSEDAKKKAQECLKQSGHIKIGFTEITVTRLPSTLDNGERID